MPESQAPGELVVVAGDQVWDLGETAETRHAVCGVTRHPGYRQRVPGTGINLDQDKSRGVN